MSGFSIYFFTSNLKFTKEVSRCEIWLFQELNLPVLSVPNSLFKNHGNILKLVGRIRTLILWLKALFSYRINYIVHPKRWEGRFLRGRERQLLLFLFDIYQKPYWTFLSLVTILGGKKLRIKMEVKLQAHYHGNMPFSLIMKPLLKNLWVHFNLGRNMFVDPLFIWDN